MPLRNFALPFEKSRYSGCSSKLLTDFSLPAKGKRTHVLYHIFAFGETWSWCFMVLVGLANLKLRANRKKWEHSQLAGYSISRLGVACG